MSVWHPYRDRLKGVQIVLSNSQAEPGRTVQQEQEEISPNHVQRLNLISVSGYEVESSNTISQFVMQIF